MKFIYATDLHGNIAKYETIYNLACDLNIKLIHLGADLLPKGPSILTIQKKFVCEYLKKFYNKCKQADIQVLAFFGNDDIYTRKKYFTEYADLLDEKPVVIDDYLFKAYPYVPDYPFGLKTACKLDYKGWLAEPWNGKPIDIDEQGFYTINNLEKYFSNKGTIDEDLRKITANKQTIMAIHSPPQGLGLDVCMDGRRVGSKSVTEWIEREQPLILLAGHLHESYHVTCQWHGYIGDTLVIQPGQLNKTNLVIIDIDKTVKAELYTL